MGTEISRKGARAKLYIGPIPGRKQEAICVEEGVHSWPVAYLRDAEDRDRFINALTELMKPLLFEPLGILESTDPEVNGAYVIRPPTD